MNTQRRRIQLLVIALLLFIPVALLQSRIDPIYQKNYAPAKTIDQAGQNLPIEFALGAFTGFREAVAGLLWVRTDQFFDDGNYAAIMPLIRVITWLDPHQIDVYATGAWHMDYNFTDSQERSDRRYIPLSLALIKEGIANNPDEPDLYSDEAFVHYFRKIADYTKSASVFADGWQVVLDNSKHLNDQTSFDKVDKGVMTVGHGYAHALEAEGNIPAALAQWNQCIAIHNLLVKQKPDDISEEIDREIASKQLYELQERMKYRPIDTKTPVNLDFHPQLVRVAPKVFVLKGTINIIGATQFNMETGSRTFGPVDGARVEIILEDKGYVRPIIQNYTLNSAVDPSVTIMQDAVSVRGGKIGGDPGRKIDMSQDPEMYSFKAPVYTVTVWFMPNDPNDTPIEVQDRIGWLGEGITDPNYLVVSNSKTLLPADVTPIPGLRYLAKTYTLTREDILGKGKKVFN
jgi:hypothetical protein